MGTENIKIEKYAEYINSGEDWLGEVPANWELTRLGTRFFERRTKVSDKDYAPLSVTKQGILPQLDNAAKTNDGDNRKLVKAGDFVINSRSDRKGSSGISNLDGSVSLINIVIEPKGINPIFCNYLFKSNGFIEEFYRNGHGIVADLWTTRYDEMKAIKIALPSKSEQTRIATFLDQKTAQIDQAIAQKERLIELLKERRQILIHNAVTRGLDPNVKMKDSGVEWIGMVPEGWEVKRVKNYCHLNENTLTEDTSKSLEIQYVDIGSVTFENGITHTENLVFKDAPSRARRLAKIGDTVMSTVRTYLKAIDFIDQIKSHYVFSTGFAVLHPVDINPFFLSYFVKSDAFTNQVDVFSTGMSYPAINSTDLGRLYVAAPLPSEQIAIAAYLDRKTAQITTAINYKRAEIEKLKEYKATLINSAVTGKIKIT